MATETAAATRRRRLSRELIQASRGRHTSKIFQLNFNRMKNYTSHHSTKYGPTLRVRSATRMDAVLCGHSVV